MNFGSLNNLMLGNIKPPTPELGMGATILMWTDRRPCTVIAISPSGKRITVQEDHWNDGQFSPDANAQKVDYTLRKCGRWVRQGSRTNGGEWLRLGKRDYYYDMSF